MISGGIVFPFFPQPLPFALPDRLRENGLDVTLYSPEIEVDPATFDLVLYLFGDETLLTRGRIFLDCLALTGHFGRAMQRYWHEIPTAMITFGYPYMQRAALDLLLGKAEWNRHNPVDPFCGLPDARY